MQNLKLKIKNYGRIIIMSLLLVVSCLLLVNFGCGQQTTETATTTTAAATTTTAGVTTTTTASTTTTSTGAATSTTTSVTTTTSGGGASAIFNVSGATAIASANKSSAGASSVKAASTNANDVLKLTEAGDLVTILSLESSWVPTVTVIETGPDGTLYVGFDSKIYGTKQDGSWGSLGAFFRIWPNGTAEVVDEDIDGLYTWYSYSQNGELPVKQVQFDNDGNVFYLGYSSGNRILKKKSTSGVISRIGSSNMYVRDFLVCPNGFVLFHGSSSGTYSIEWLRVIYNSAVNSIFYNDGSSGWLRAYYKDVNNNVILVGSGLVLEDNESNLKKYSGIIRISLTDAGVPATVEALYDDNNMYSDTYTTIGSQLNWGYWDPDEMEYKQFFATNQYGATNLPLSLESGVSEEFIRAFIRTKYKTITWDNLNAVTFEGMTSNESYVYTEWLDTIVAANISGESWREWRNANGLQGVAFANAKQLLFSDTGALYAVMSLDSWGGTAVKGDKLFQIINTTGEAEIAAFPQNSNYKSINRIRLYGDYAIYSSNRLGKYKLFRYDLTNPTVTAVDMIPNKNNIEIYSFNFNPLTSMLIYDVYDLSNNTSYLAQQEITSTTVADETTAEADTTIIDMVPFTATN